MNSDYADSLCNKCIEAFIAGDRVYCGAYGSFRSLLENLPECAAFSLDYTGVTINFIETESENEIAAFC